MQKKASKSNDNLLDVYFKQVKAFPLLTFEDELELSQKIIEGDVDALHKLVNSNLRLVVKIAGLFNVPGVPILDMIQEGNIGLIHAAQKFDYRKNVRFCTYASFWIRQFISRFIAKRRRLVRLPQRKEETLRKIQHAYHSLCQNLMHQPNNLEIAKELGIPVRDVDSFISLASDSLYYEQNNTNETVCAVDVHEDYTYNPELNLMKQASRDGAMNILNKLKDREARILSYRYQLNGCEHHTLREIGDKLNISPETVRQIEKKALKKIRVHANELKEYLYVEAM
ncbi:MAG: RNA polymerase sigma factor RpoD/SigA [Treponema sp.]|nr:RNA polymerase sigma factor RpoD/SigA [Treponema sp.]